jgi:hypothetical protein
MVSVGKMIAREIVRRKAKIRIADAQSLTLWLSFQTNTLLFIVILRKVQ